MRHGLVWPYHVSHSRTLNPQLRTEKGQACSVNGRPDFFLTGNMGMGLTRGHGVDRYSDHVPNGGQAVHFAEEISVNVASTPGSARERGGSSRLRVAAGYLRRLLPRVP